MSEPRTPNPHRRCTRSPWLALAVILALLLSSCGLRDPYDTVTTTRVASRSNTSAIGPGEQDGPTSGPAGKLAAGLAQATPAAALSRYGSLYVNWSWQTVAAHERRLAGLSVGQAHAQALAAAAQPQPTLARYAVHNQGQIVGSPAAKAPSAANGRSSPTSRPPATAPTRVCRPPVTSPGPPSSATGSSGWCPAGTRETDLSAVTDRHEAVQHDGRAGDPRQSAEKPGRLAAVAGLCGGAGASTLAYLLCCAAITDGQRPVLWWTRPAAAESPPTLACAPRCRSRRRASTFRPAGPPSPDGCLPPPRTTSAVLCHAPSLGQPLLALDGANRLLADARTAHALTVIDCGTLTSDHERLALANADHVLLIVPASRPGIERAAPLRRPSTRVLPRRSERRANRTPRAARAQGSSHRACADRRGDRRDPRALPAPRGPA